MRSTNDMFVYNDEMFFGAATTGAAKGEEPEPPRAEGRGGERTGEERAMERERRGKRERWRRERATVIKSTGNKNRFTLAVYHFIAVHRS